MISRRFNRLESCFMASACASAPRSLRSTGALLTRLDCSNGDEGLHYAFIGASFVQQSIRALGRDCLAHCKKRQEV
jgi:hypothetical protein